MKILRPVLMTLSFIFAGPVLAQNISTQASLIDFIAFASEGMDLRRSDHQGLTGAGGDVSVSNFLFEGNQSLDLALSVGGRLQFDSGSAVGNLEARQASLFRMDARNSNGVGFISTLQGSQIRDSSVRTRKVRHLSVDHRALTREMFAAADLMASWPATVFPTVQNGGYKAILSSGTNVLSFGATDLQNLPKLVLDGPVDADVVIVIHGEEVILRHLQVVLRGGLRPNGIRWVLPNATWLFIANTHDAVYGIPGIIIAPCATTEFYEGLITGGLWVRSLIFDDSRGLRASGQINRFQARREGCRCSRGDL